MTANNAAEAPWPSTITLRFETRSAVTPPNGPRANMLIPTPRLTIPTARFVPPSSKATTDWVTNIIMSASVAKSDPTQRMRKFGSAKAAKVVESQRPITGTH